MGTTSEEKRQKERGLNSHEAHKLFKNKLVLGLSQSGFYVWSNETGAVQSVKGHYVSYGLTGSADIIGLAHGGIFIACECKTRTGKLSPKQEAFKLAVEKRGGIYYEARWTPERESSDAAVMFAVAAIRDKIGQICSGKA